MMKLHFNLLFTHADCNIFKASDASWLIVNDKTKSISKKIPFEGFPKFEASVALFKEGEQTYQEELIIRVAPDCEITDLKPILQHYGRKELKGETVSLMVVNYGTE